MLNHVAHPSFRKRLNNGSSFKSFINPLKTTTIDGPISGQKYDWFSVYWTDRDSAQAEA